MKRQIKFVLTASIALFITGGSILAQTQEQVKTQTQTQEQVKAQTQEQVKTQTQAPPAYQDPVCPHLPLHPRKIHRLSFPVSPLLLGPIRRQPLQATPFLSRMLPDG